IKVPTLRPNNKNERFVTKIVCYNAAEMVKLTGAKAISTLTYSGYTAFQISSYRPLAYILVFTPNERIIRRLNLLWGVKAMYYEGGDKSRSEEHTSELQSRENLVCRLLLEKKQKAGTDSSA